jgi:hypothetical protein
MENYNIMKNLFLLLFVFYGLNGIAQTPTYTISMKGDFYGDTTCPVVQILPGNYYFSVTTEKGVHIMDMSNGIYDENGYDIDNYEINDHVPAEPNTTHFKITYHCACEDESVYNNPPRQGETYPLLIDSFIKNFYGIEEISSPICSIKFSVLSFKPNNLVITNSSPTNNICSGEALNLTASPAGFPNSVYHWQYSLDNKSTWTDVPNKIINNLPTTDSPTPRFTMYDILGEDHVNHFGPIYFRLGYGGAFTYDQNREFSEPVIINYSPCTLVIKDRKYVAPDCNGDSVKSIIAYFDRNLESNETLFPFQIIPYPKQSGDPIKLSQNEVKSLLYDPVSKWYTYSFVIPTDQKLENRKYAIEYQSLVNGAPRGTLISDDPFLYEDPAPLTFSISQIDPVCNNEAGKITITANGGSGEYYYYSLDGGTTKIKFTNKTLVTTTIVNGIPTETRTSNQEVTLHTTGATVYNVLVTDTNGCIEK